MFLKLPKELYDQAEGDWCRWDYRNYLPKVRYIFSWYSVIGQGELF